MTVQEGGGAVEGMTLDVEGVEGDAVAVGVAEEGAVVGEG